MFRFFGDFFGLNAWNDPGSSLGITKSRILKLEIFVVGRVFKLESCLDLASIYDDALIDILVSMDLVGYTA